MLKKFIPTVLIIQSVLCSTIPQRKSVAEVPRFLESLLNLNQISDDDSLVQAHSSQELAGQPLSISSRDEEFNPRIMSNAQYIVDVLNRGKIGRRAQEKREYEKARKMLNDLGCRRKVRAALYKVKYFLSSKLQMKYRDVLASPGFFSDQEKDKINELFLQVGYSEIIDELNKDISWTRPVSPRTLKIVLSSTKYYSVAERQKVVGLFRGGSKDAILQTRKEVRKLLEEDSSWTRPVRDDALKQIEEDLAMELMR
ncbi:hypothetical protein ROZALSC1DRAFT_28941 [Rozella allomycis CSF55]|uniref:Uncharacterized protein n=1 Tax=Rozella allomycis (strain CSF55) TaxID=988480 RepID=A0A075B3E2_ROZAC|nr:hypothetical protein O9G_005803 [Rozella allomycis CSF55]RKP19468.1 hypothetical protein ROZALSC1DRAFT_28941 [Rozella allomycis CSF55]|eukprot:EPZ37065.1 hypothetical protein O9G_005803 [Rozella allomycis CSF55]